MPLARRSHTHTHHIITAGNPRQRSSPVAARWWWVPTRCRRCWRLALPPAYAARAGAAAGRGTGTARCRAAWAAGDGAAATSCAWCFVSEARRGMGSRGLCCGANALAPERGGCCCDRTADERSFSVLIFLPCLPVLSYCRTACLQAPAQICLAMGASRELFAGVTALAHQHSAAPCNVACSLLATDGLELPGATRPVACSIQRGMSGAAGLEHHRHANQHDTGRLCGPSRLGLRQASPPPPSASCVRVVAFCIQCSLLTPAAASLCIFTASPLPQRGPAPGAARGGGVVAMAK